MFRGLVIFMLAIVLVQSTGVVPFAAVECRDSCIDDQADGRCAPACDDCLCCLHPQAAPLRTVLAAAPPALTWSTRVEWRDSTSSPHSRDILHVPIYLLA